MCGLVGMLALDARKKVDPVTLLRMSSCLKHRGPDGEGHWTSGDGRVALAHRRLAIVDLNPGAAQPMSDASGRYQLVFNGEIYNHMDLRLELENLGRSFVTDHSDTETLLMSLREWGLYDALNKLEGDFAFALWDSEKGVLSLARDRAGVKPLYFHLAEETFSFASEMKSLMEDPGVERVLSEAALSHFLTFMAVPSPLTLISGIFKMPPGSWMTITSEGTIEGDYYWRPARGISKDSFELSPRSTESQIEISSEKVLDLLTASVKKRMMSDVPTGVFLSGGVDSSLIVALMTEMSHERVNTFSIGFSDFPNQNELSDARRTAEKFQTEHHEILINHADVEEYLVDLVADLDEPIADWVAIPLHFLAKEAAAHGVKVIQVGEGADEQFSGYASHSQYLRLNQRLWSLWGRTIPRVSEKFALRLFEKLVPERHSPSSLFVDFLFRLVTHKPAFLSGAIGFWPLAKARLFPGAGMTSPTLDERLAPTGFFPDRILSGDSVGYVEDLLSVENEGKFLDFLSSVSYIEQSNRLPELLLGRVDKITMASSIEARVPFLDHSLTDYSASLPHQLKVHDGIGKYVLKMAGKKYLSDELLFAKKRGFGAPVVDWLNGPLGKYVRAVVLGSDLKRHYLRASYVDSIVAANAKTGKFGLEVWILYSVSAWYDKWIAQP